MWVAGGNDYDFDQVKGWVWPMDPLEPLDAAMITAELLSDPLHVAALLILSPPADAGPGYVEELYQEALTDTAELDPRFRRHPHVASTPPVSWVWRADDRIDMREHLQRRTLLRAGIAKCCGS